MTPVRIVSLVEGDGEVQALPVLLRRVVYAIDPIAVPEISAFRHSAGSSQRPGGIERAIETVAALYPKHSIIVLLDCDDDCPKTLGQELTQRAKAARPDIFVSLVLARCEYEAWFLAAAESLAGKRNLATDLIAPNNPENIRDAKGWLSRRLSRSGRYSPTEDQAALSHWLDLDLARARSRSFRKLWKEVEAIVEHYKRTDPDA
jgi:hypothetical protein